MAMRPKGNHGGLYEIRSPYLKIRLNINNYNMDSKDLNVVDFKIFRSQLELCFAASFLIII